MDEANTPEQLTDGQMTTPSDDGFVESAASYLETVAHEENGEVPGRMQEERLDDGDAIASSVNDLPGETDEAFEELVDGFTEDAEPVIAPRPDELVRGHAGEVRTVKDGQVQYSRNTHGELDHLCENS